MKNRRKEKPLIYVFCEGESEIEYIKLLKKKFAKSAHIEKISKGLFREAENCFSKDVRYRNYTDVIDEIWFFFDVDKGEFIDHAKAGFWEDNYKIIKRLRKMRKNPAIKVRLLMTTGCVEYWFLLHYDRVCPSVQTDAEKNHVINSLKKKEKLNNYKKGNSEMVKSIFEYMDCAIKNGQWVLSLLKTSEIPTLEDTDERNSWLYKSNKTFTTVHEAIEYLKSL